MQEALGLIRITSVPANITNVEGVVLYRVEQALIQEQTDIVFQYRWVSDVFGPSDPASVTVALDKRNQPPEVLPARQGPRRADGLVEVTLQSRDVDGSPFLPTPYVFYQVHKPPSFGTLFQVPPTPTCP